MSGVFDSKGIRITIKNLNMASDRLGCLLKNFFTEWSLFFIPVLLGSIISVSLNEFCLFKKR